MTPEMDLYAAVVTSTLSDKVYEKGGERVERIKTLMQKCGSIPITLTSFLSKKISV